MNDTDKVPDLRGVFIRGLNSFLDDGRQKILSRTEGEKRLNPEPSEKAGDFQEDAFQGHKHKSNGALIYNRAGGEKDGGTQGGAKDEWDKSL